MQNGHSPSNSSFNDPGHSGRCCLHAEAAHAKAFRFVGALTKAAFARAFAARCANSRAEVDDKMKTTAIYTSDVGV